MHRPGARHLFVDEVAEAFELLRHFSEAGQRVPDENVPELRRVLLRACRYHVYYVDTAAAVLVVAIWSAIRGRGPDLRGT